MFELSCIPARKASLHPKTCQRGAGGKFTSRWRCNKICRAIASRGVNSRLFKLKHVQQLVRLEYQCDMILTKMINTEHNLIVIDELIANSKGTKCSESQRGACASSPARPNAATFDDELCPASGFLCLDFQSPSFAVMDLNTFSERSACLPTPPLPASNATNAFCAGKGFCAGEGFCGDVVLVATPEVATSN